MAVSYTHLDVYKRQDLADDTSIIVCSSQTGRAISGSDRSAFDGDCL